MSDTVTVTNCTHSSTDPTCSTCMQNMLKEMDTNVAASLDANANLAQTTSGIDSRAAAMLHRRVSAAGILQNTKHKHSLSDPFLSKTLSIAKEKSSTQPVNELHEVLLACRTQQSRINSQDENSEITLELQKENSHFFLSEMLISAIEQMKWRQVLLNENYLNGSVSEEVYEDSGTVQDAGPFSTSTPDPDQKEFPKSSDVASTAQLKPSLNATELSAEAIAVSLLRSFSLMKSVPGNATLDWLVSYRDAPQSLLPMPSSIAVDPDVIDLGFGQMKLRGNSGWAPPRAQLVLTPHKIISRKALLEDQGYRCAGCGMKLQKEYLKRVVYCNYLGRYFCQCCHRGETAVIPTKVLHNWDFRRFPVSDFAWKFLDRHWSDPVYDVSTVNPAIYRHVRLLRLVRERRRLLCYLWDYIKTCRKASSVSTKDGMLYEVFEKIPLHWRHHLDIYSMEDFAKIHSQHDVISRMDFVILVAQTHVEACECCQPKGFVCEICQNPKVIFPFQTKTVKRCDSCGACFHKTCWERCGKICPRCQRLELRRAANKYSELLDSNPDATEETQLTVET